MSNPCAMSLGLPGGAETETDSVMATPSKGLVGKFQTPDWQLAWALLGSNQ